MFGGRGSILIFDNSLPQIVFSFPFVPRIRIYPSLLGTLRFVLEFKRYSAWLFQCDPDEIHVLLTISLQRIHPYVQAKYLCGAIEEPVRPGILKINRNYYQ